jgi:hypothetical protein
MRFPVFALLVVALLVVALFRNVSPASRPPPWMLDPEIY